jgi:ketosteroid isomerase-like protein
VTVDPDVARRAFAARVEAWLAADVDAYLACWTDDMVITIPSRHAPIRGKDLYRKIVMQSFAWARPVAFDVHHLAVDGPVVLAEWTISAQRTGDGVTVEWHGASACGMDDDGRIEWWREYHRGPPAPVG